MVSLNVTVQHWNQGIENMQFSKMVQNRYLQQGIYNF